jgi:hypothetical protein
MSYNFFLSGLQRLIIEASQLHSLGLIRMSDQPDTVICLVMMQWINCNHNTLPDLYEFIHVVRYRVQ